MTTVNWSTEETRKTANQTVAQLTNVSDYQGYKLTTVLGFDITRRYQEVEGTRTRTRGFLTVYAGVEQ